MVTIIIFWHHNIEHYACCKLSHLIHISREAMATMSRKVIASNEAALIATITGVGNTEPGRRVPFELGWINNEDES